MDGNVCPTLVVFIRIAVSGNFEHVENANVAFCIDKYFDQLFVS